MSQLFRCNERVYSRRQTLAAWLSMFFLGAFAMQATAQEPQISTEDQQRINRLVEAVLDCQLSDGAIPVVGYRFEGQPVLIDPYFSNLALLGVLAAHQQNPDPRIERCVARWLQWCVANQNADGTYSRVEGTLSAETRSVANSQSRAPDSHDAYAGTFLAVVASAFSAQSHPPSPEVLLACRQSFQVIERCRDPENEFYWNFEPQQVPAGAVLAQYLLDNLEVHQGLLAAQKIFSAANDVELATQAQDRAAALAISFHKFYHPEHKYFGCMYGDVVTNVPWGKQIATSERLATVSALAFLENIDPETGGNLWNKLMQNHGKALIASFSTRKFIDEDPTVERVYFASLRAASEPEKKRLLGMVRNRSDQLLKIEKQLELPGQQSQPFPYVHRYGMLAQSLLANSGKLPNELPKVPLNSALWGEHIRE
ncbi:MAG: hypothetical protein J0M26_26710 [Planctomycetes bacterium]|nr:hypothetical protein [Planctomycetota bacterium]